jgi:Flp pilus assembly protein TadG
MTRRRREPSKDRGSAAIWALLVTATAFTLLLGLVVDGGRVIDARLEASRAAAQAARIGTDALAASSVRNGHDRVDVTAAVTRAQAYLHQAGMRGTVQVRGDAVSVTVTGRSATRILGVVGIDSFPIEETQTARAITEQDPP